MSSPARPEERAGGELLRRAERFTGEARQWRSLSAPNDRLLALTLRAQLAQVIQELRDGCAAMAGDMAASRLRQTATAAYRARTTTGRIRN